MGSRSHPDLSNYAYFVTTICGDRRRVFSNAIATRLVVRILNEVRDEEGARLLSYVIMPDHVHLLIVPGRLGLGNFMKLWKGRFARSWNKETDRSGSIWQERYYESVMRGDEQIERCIQYIDANPVKAGLCTRPEEYPWSSAGPEASDLAAYLAGDTSRTEVRPSVSWGMPR
jgi:REP element-mobilizing transposase RayT